MQRHETVRYAERARNSPEWLEHELYGGSHERPPRASVAVPNTWGLDPKSTGKPSEGFEQKIVRLSLIFYEDHSSSCVMDQLEVRGETR